MSNFLTAVLSKQVIQVFDFVVLTWYWTLLFLWMGNIKPQEIIYFYFADL